MGVARQMLLTCHMRAFVAVVIIAGLGVVYLWQKHGEQPATSSEATTAQAAPSPAQAASPPREASEHNWMKRSLDRARDVRDQARAQTRDSQNP